MNTGAAEWLKPLNAKRNLSVLVVSVVSLLPTPGSHNSSCSFQSPFVSLSFYVNKSALYLTRRRDRRANVKS